VIQTQTNFTREELDKKTRDIEGVLLDYIDTVVEMKLMIASI
jgi:hypothetical protein